MCEVVIARAPLPRRSKSCHTMHPKQTRRGLKIKILDCRRKLKSKWWHSPLPAPPSTMLPAWPRTEPSQHWRGGGGKVRLQERRPNKQKQNHWRGGACQGEATKTKTTKNTTPERMIRESGVKRGLAICANTTISISAYGTRGGCVCPRVGRMIKSFRSLHTHMTARMVRL